jgi:hypothetical protein
MSDLGYDRFEAEFRGWMVDEASIAAPDRLVETVMDDVRRIGAPRRVATSAVASAFRWPWLRGLQAYAGLTVAIAVGVALGLGLVTALGVLPRVGVPVTPTPAVVESPTGSASPTPAGSPRSLVPNGSFAIPANALVALGADLWVVRSDVPRLDAVDPASTAVSRSLALDATGIDIVEAGGFLWLSEPDGTVLQIDPASGTITARVAAGGTELAAGESAVWVGGSGSVARIDPATAEVGATYPVPGYAAPHGLVAAFGSVWLGGNQQIVRLDQATGQTQATIPGDAADLVATTDTVWARRGTELVAIDPATSTVGSILEGVPGGSILAADGRSIWAAGITLVRLDPETGVVASGEISTSGDPAAAVLVAFGGTWVAAQQVAGGPRLLLRFGP